MKRFKKILAGLLSAALLVSAALPVFAAEQTTETYSVTITNSAEGHTYEAYQIFAGELSVNDEGQKVLSNIVWGSNADGAAIISALNTAGVTVASDATAADVAKAIADTTTVAAEKIADALESGITGTPAGSTNVQTNGKYVISALEAGYYVVKDKDDTLEGQDTAYTDFILQVVGSVEIEAKADSPSVIKKVLEESYTPDDGFGTGYNDVADYDISDEVPFELIGTVPNADSFADYETYQYIFTDTMSNGLTFNADSLQVFLSADGNTSDSATLTLIDASLYTVSSAAHSFTVAFADLKAVDGVTASSKIVVRFTATLNANAVVGLPGNENEVYLEYSNNPNDDGEGLGRTPEDKVIVFTYEVDTKKVDSADNETTLKDAEFKLLNANKTLVATVDENDRIASWDEIETDAEGNITNGSTLVSDENGLFKAIGLDDGTYYLRETKAPTGYNLLLEDVEVVVDATTANSQDWDGTPSSALITIDVTANEIPGTALEDLAGGQITIANGQGTILPSTGGRGTVLFYVIGGVLIIAAVAFFAVKRRSK